MHHRSVACGRSGLQRYITKQHSGYNVRTSRISPTAVPTPQPPVTPHSPLPTPHPPHTYPTPSPLWLLISMNCVCRHMLQFNPDNYKYHHGLRRALNLLPDASGNLSDSQREQLSQLYDGLQAQYPRSSAARRIPLDFKVCLAFLAITPITFGLSCHHTNLTKVCVFVAR